MISPNDMDSYYMRLALKEASKGIGYTSPNPTVGAVIVKEGRVIGKGYHKRAGLPHAEVEAIQSCRESLEGSTMYVTLEPCNHQGRTPPCTKAILEAGIRRVVIGVKDPNPNVKGGGAEELKRHGISVITGILEEDCKRINEGYFKFVKTGFPFLVAKVAMTMDGFIATSIGESKWITGDEARVLVHRIRDRVDGVMVGVGTVLKDDPILNVRLKDKRPWDPVRIVLDTHLRTPTHARVIREGAGRTIILTGDHISSEALSSYEGDRCNIVRCPTKNGRIDIKAAVQILAGLGLVTIMVEGGANLLGSLVRERLVDKFYIFFAPKLLCGDDGVPMIRGKGVERIEKCLRVEEIKVERVGKDILVSGYPLYPESWNIWE